MVCYFSIKNPDAVDDVKVGCDQVSLATLMNRMISSQSLSYQARLNRWRAIGQSGGIDGFDF